MDSIDLLQGMELTWIINLTF